MRKCYHESLHGECLLIFSLKRENCGQLEKSFEP